jgi:hypothetical protein
MATGYSGTPLAKKLGFKPGMRALLIDPPAGYRALLAPIPAGVRFARAASKQVALVHAFHTERAALARDLNLLRKTLADDAMLWVSWPKRASKVPTDITEDVIRALALPLGWVDVKVCAVDTTWSGLKLVVRKTERRA